MSRHVGEVAEGLSDPHTPRWRHGRLWFCDGRAGRVLTVDGRGQIEEVLQVPGEPSGLGWLPDGRMLVLVAADRCVLRCEPTGEVVTHADLSSLELVGRPHDLLVAFTGRAYVGDVRTRPAAEGPVEPSRLCCIQPDGTVSAVADGLYFPNGMVLLPDYTLVVAETHKNRMVAFNKGTDGSLTNRRPWAAFGDQTAIDGVGVPTADVAPHGICADNNGDIWVADPIGNRVVHVREGGEILEEITTGGLSPSACMLGGDDGRTLYLCAVSSFAEQERRETRDATLLSVRVDVPHGALP